MDVSKFPYIAGMSRIGFPSFTQDLELIYILGETELRVQLAWVEGVRLSPSLISQLASLSQTFLQGVEKRYGFFGRDA